MNKLLAAILLLALGGCGILPSTEQDSERKFVLAAGAWQGLHALDAAQTLHIARAPECFHEADPMTKRIIGEHPSEAEVAAVMVGYSIAHHYLSRWLKRKAQESEPGSTWRTTRTAWAFGSLALKAYVVGNNHAIGLRPYGKGC